MKKILVIPVLFICTFASAQRFIIHAGTTISNLYNSDMYGAPYNNYRASLTANAGIQYLNLKHFSLSSSIGYLQKGGAERNSANIRYVDKYDFLTFNTILKIKTTGTGIVKPFFNVGAYVGRSFNRKDAEKINTGAVVGLGLGKKLLKHEVGIEANYLPSFNALYDKIGIDSHVRITDHTFTLTGYITF